MKCPKCGPGYLEPVETEDGSFVGVCGECSSHWFNSSPLAYELYTVADVPRPEQEVGLATQTEMICPNCPESKLVQFLFAPAGVAGDEPLFLEFCPTCHGGVLDRGELAYAQSKAEGFGLMNLKHTLGRLARRGSSTL